MRCVRPEELKLSLLMGVAHGEDQTSVFLCAKLSGRRNSSRGYL